MRFFYPARITMQTHRKKGLLVFFEWCQCAIGEVLRPRTSPMAHRHHLKKTDKPFLRCVCIVIPCWLKNAHHLIAFKLTYLWWLWYPVTSNWRCSRLHPHLRRLAFVAGKRWCWSILGGRDVRCGPLQGVLRHTRPLQLCVRYKSGDPRKWNCVYWNRYELSQNKTYQALALVEILRFLSI